MLSVAAIALLVALLYSDLHQRRLPNRLVAVYAVLCPIALLASGAAPATWLQHGVVALAAFVFFLALFALGGMGGGDVKMGTAVLAWAGVQTLSESLLLIAMSGLVLALLGLAADRLSGLRGSARKSPAANLWRKALHALSAKRGVPYGVALAMGGMAALPLYW
ncbi:prepilin peptidase [Pusillimonas sp.]|uniref:prepilin peptidase n=1 Tax=Pusillimonas sp. TaxID=3040095 RepID=UPI0037C75E4F